MTATQHDESTAADGGTTPEQFEAEARAFLDANAERRPEETFVWGQGSDEREPVSGAHPRAGSWPTWPPRVPGPRQVFDAGFGWITGPAEYGGRGLPTGLPADLGTGGRRLPDPVAGHLRHRPRHGRPDHPGPRHRRGEGGLPPQDVAGRHRGLPAVQRAVLRLRPRLAPDPGRAGRRRMGDQRPEGVDVRCPGVGHRRDHLPHRPRPAQAPGPHRLRRRHARTRRGGPSPAPDDRRCLVQRGVLHRRAGAGLAPSR